jgi:hypothetical protein
MQDSVFFVKNRRTLNKIKQLKISSLRFATKQREGRL